MKQVIARWESRSGKHWVELYRDQFGHGYQAQGAGGFLGGGLADEQAIAQIERRLNDFQPDKSKTPMKRVR